MFKTVNAKLDGLIERLIALDKRVSPVLNQFIIVMALLAAVAGGILLFGRSFY